MSLVMKTLCWACFFLLVFAAGFGLLGVIGTVFPTLPADLRGVVATGLTLAAAAIVVEAML